MLPQGKTKQLFNVIHTFVNLLLHYGMMLFLIYVLSLKDCLEICFWICIKFKNRIIWSLHTFCLSKYSVWTALIDDVGKELSGTISFKNLHERELSNKNSTNLNRSNNSSHFNVESNSLESELINSDTNIKCQNCQILVKAFLLYNNTVRNVQDSNEVVNKIFKNSVGTQTIIEPEHVNTVQSVYLSPIRSTKAPFLEELNSEDSLTSRFECSNIEKLVALQCSLSPVSNEYKNRSTTSSNHEVSKIENVKRVNDGSPAKIDPSETLVSTPLKARESVSHLLESPLCQINLESMRLKFSEDICIPNLSPEQQSIFKKSWRKLKQMHQVNKRVREAPIIIPTITQPSSRNAHNFSREYENVGMIGCCGNMFHKLKSKFDQKPNMSSVFYKRF